MYWFLKVLSWLACRFSMDTCISVGNFLGRLTWYGVPGKRKRMGIDNVMRCLGTDEQEAERKAREGQMPQTLREAIGKIQLAALEKKEA